MLFRISFDAGDQFFDGLHRIVKLFTVNSTTMMLMFKNLKLLLTYRSCYGC